MVSQIDTLISIVLNEASILTMKNETVSLKRSLFLKFFWKKRWLLCKILQEFARL